MMDKDSRENAIKNSVTNNTVNNYGIIIGDVSAANYSRTAVDTSEIEYRVRPDFKNSNRKSHILLCKVYNSQLDGDLENNVQILRDALETEEHETVPDIKTIAFIKNFLVHFLLADRSHDEEALKIIDDIISIDDIKKDTNFYEDVLYEKIKVLGFCGKIVQARSTINLIDKISNSNHKEKPAYWENVGRVAFYEGDVEQAVRIFKVGMNQALEEFTSASRELDKRASYQHYYAFLTLLGEVYREIQRPDKSLSLWRKAVAAAEKIELRKEKANSLLPYVECLIQYERWEDALISLEKAYNIKKEDKDTKFFWHYYNLKASVFLHRNDLEKNDVQEAINCLYDLLQCELDVSATIKVLQTIAFIQADHGYREAALNTLNAADQIISETKETVFRENIDIQRRDIKESSVFFDQRIRYSDSPVTLEELNTMIERHNVSEVYLERLNLAFNIGMGYIEIDADKSYSWLTSAVARAEHIGNLVMAAQALIAQVSILFNKKSEEAEIQAHNFVDKAIDLIADLPIWDTHARTKIFKGLLAAHKENFNKAHQYFKDAKGIIDSHRIKDQYLEEYVLGYIEECEFILSRKQFTDLDFSSIIDEMNYLKSWFPKYRKEMMQFLWYNRHEDIEKLIASSYKAKTFIISDSEKEIQEWSEGINALFDIISFCSETDYHVEENWNFAKTLPVPKNMKSKFFNVFVVLDA